MMPIILALGVVVLTVAGQILWKLGISGHVHDLNSFFTALMSPLVIIGAIIYLIATAIWLLMLSKYQYHHIYPLLSLSFVFALLASRFIFHEEVAWMSWLGVAIICFGVIIIGLTNK